MSRPSLPVPARLRRHRPRGPAGPGPLRHRRPPDDGYWTATDRRPAVTGATARRVEPKRYAAFTLDRTGIRAALDRAPAEEPGRADGAGAVVTVPAPNGELVDFRVHRVAVMEAGLAARHPEITTYAGRGVGDPTATIRLDLTPMGFHASVRGAGDRRLVRRPGLQRRRQPLPLLPRRRPAGTASAASSSPSSTRTTVQRARHEPAEAPGSRGPAAHLPARAGHRPVLRRPTSAPRTCSPRRSR